eukprot:686382-Rhodomonas_salina.1
MVINYDLAPVIVQSGDVRIRGWRVQAAGSHADAAHVQGIYIEVPDWSPSTTCHEHCISLVRNCGVEWVEELGAGPCAVYGGGG